MMKKIIIVGSKPNAKIPDDGEIYLCANTAGYYYKDKIKGEIISVVSASEIVESKRKNNKKEEWLKNKLENLKNTNSKSFILLTPEHFPNSKRNLKQISKKPTEYLSLKDLDEMCFNITNYNFPIYNYNYSLNFKYNIKFLIEFFKYIFKPNYLFDSLFRPSTGIISILLAIKLYPKCKYHITGIGINNRGVYPDGVINEWTPQKKINQNHVLADLKILKRLYKKYNITIDDNELLSKIEN